MKTVDKVNSIERAKEFAQQLHQDHKRISGESYFDHVCRVHEKLKAFNVAEDLTLIAAYLHHSLDFEEVSKEIEREFGPEVIEIVQNFRRVSQAKIGKDSPQEFNEKYIIQAYINLSKDLRTLVIRLADKIDNLENSLVLSKKQRNYIAERALYLYAPLAKIIGLSKMADSLQNEAFKIVNPHQYMGIKKVIDQKVDSIDGTFAEIKEFLANEFEENEINHYEIQTRVKSIYSLYRKINYYRRKGRVIKDDLKGVHDLAAMRIVVDTIEQCYFVENMLRNLWEYYPDERDDYIKNPRPNGYQSIHNVFQVDKGLDIEVQIRTYNMHEQNEYGLTSHLMYKLGDKGADSQSVKKFKNYLKENPYWFKDLNFWESEKTLSEYKPEVPFSKNIYAFTPKGDIIELPKGSCPVDFAYSLHSGLGNKCVGAFANGEIVKLDYEIENGDTIEIRTLKSRREPSRDWLKFVKTRKAKSAIRKALEKNS